MKDISLYGHLTIDTLLTEGEREKKTLGSMANVWKALVECRTLENLDTYTCFADTGIGIILKRTNKRKLKIFTDDFSKLKFNDYLKNLKEYMNLIEYKDLKNLF